jgi:hypothetical protein
MLVRRLLLEAGLEEGCIRYFGMWDLDNISLSSPSDSPLTPIVQTSRHGLAYALPSPWPSCPYLIIVPD